MIAKLVSVIIPSYQRFEELKESIDSVLLQTYYNIEVIVIDDCSNDNRYLTLDEIYKGKNVNIIHLPINMREKYKLHAAQGLTRNVGLQIAKGEWIAFLDDDDAWCDSNKLKEQINAMIKYNCLLCSSNMIAGYGKYSQNNNTKSTYFNEYFRLGIEQEDKIFKFNRKDIETTNYINNSSCILHKSIVDKVGLFKGENSEDYDYWLRSLKYTEGIYIHKPFVYYDLSHAGQKHYVYT
jgi:glycosyltransferase involved in cell wall biosynthesis